MSATTATRQVRIASRRVEAQDICSFELVDPQGGPLPPFSAGSHIDVHLAPGLVRQYSLCNDPAQSQRYRIAVLRDSASRGGSVALHDLEPGRLIEISDPRNHFQLAHEARHHVLLAGGIGITPLMCMAQRLARIEASFTMHYCTRSLERTAFVEEIQAASFAGQVFFHHDDGPADQRLQAREAIGAPEPGRHLYVCGPTGFMEAMLATAREAGWTEDRLHREYFAAAPLDTAGDGAFELQLASSGAVIRVAADQTAVAALAAHGIAVPTSCEQGVCGTCLTRVLEGTPDHRDLYLTPEEQSKGDQFTPCCSRAKSARLVLDL